MQTSYLLNWQIHHESKTSTLLLLPPSSISIPSVRDTNIPTYSYIPQLPPIPPTIVILHFLLEDYLLTELLVLRTYLDIRVQEQNRMEWNGPPLARISDLACLFA